MPAAWRRAGSAVQTLGEVEDAVDERVPSRGGVGQHRHDLAVLDLVGQPAVLGSDTYALVALLDGLGVIGDEDRVGGSQARYHVVTDLVTQHVGVPDRAIEQVLERARGEQAGVLGQAPRILLRHVGQQRPQQQSERLLRFGAVEHPAQALGQSLKVSVPGGDVLGGYLLHTNINNGSRAHIPLIWECSTGSILFRQTVFRYGPDLVPHIPAKELKRFPGRIPVISHLQSDRFLSITGKVREEIRRYFALHGHY